MTAERRLTKLEGALSPKAATLLWLAEAHQFRSLPAYVDWLIDQPISAAPLERVPEQARAAAVEALRGQPREAVQQAMRQAVRDAVFLVELVIRLNLATEEAVRFGGLRYAALFWEMRALTAEAELGEGSASTRGRRSVAGRWAAWRAAVCGWLTSLSAAEEARLLLERRYFDGRSVLFPDPGRDWDTLRETAARLVGLGDGLRPLMECRRRASRSAEIEPPGLDRDALRSEARRQAQAVAARLVDEARAATLDALGESEGATAMVARRLRADTEAQPDEPTIPAQSLHPTASSAVPPPDGDAAILETTSPPHTHPCESPR